MVKARRAITMAFFDKQHQFDIQKLEGLWKKLVDLEGLAKSRGINDIFQDNGAKVLQQLIISNMKFLPGREGNDAEDRNGVEWEFKSVNIDTSARGFSTDHHTTVNLLDRFNSVPWLFSIYKGIHLQEMYVVSPGGLDEWVAKQKAGLTKHWKTNKDYELNNPKISIKYVKSHGILVYPFPNPPVDPANFD